MKRHHFSTFAAAVVAVGLVAASPEALGQSTQPSSKSPLQRTKTKLKPASETQSQRPLSTIRPTGRRDTPRQPQVRPDIESLRRGVLGSNSIQEAVRRNTGGDIDLAMNGSSATVSPVFTLNDNVPRERAARNVLDAVRSGRTPADNEELQDIIKGDTRSIADARAEYTANGFDEVRMSSGEVVFVKTDDPCSRNDVVEMLDDRVSERMYRAWVDDLRRDVRDGNWVYDEGTGNRTCANGMCSPGRPLDTFILRGQMTPEREPSEAELAELKMDDAELALNALRLGDSALAVERFESYLRANPEEAWAMRSLGVAYLNLNRVPEGVRQIAGAYEFEPSLAGEPIDVALFTGGTSGVYDLLQRVVPMAHRSPTSEAGVVAAALMQSQGRTKEAARMLERVEGKGLADKLKQEFVLAGVGQDTGAPTK
jgi:tetratricopeptide (TPR) repeat protein